MSLPLEPPYPPMEALSVEEIPTGAQWQYEPKWDGFRALIFCDGDQVRIQSKSGQPLERYFPELVTTLQHVTAKRYVIDGEIVVPVGGRLDFDELLQRIHPAQSRVNRLSQLHPALLIVFDLLVNERGTSFIDRPLEDRRLRLESFAQRFFDPDGRLRLSPATRDVRTAKKWFRAAGGNRDGIVAKRIDLAYQSGNREGMQKIKPINTADCVVGGFRYRTGKRLVGSLLLGLYDQAGLLHHVGFTSSFKTADRKPITEWILPFRGPPGFTGKAPGGPSRWSTKRSTKWEPLKPHFVVEVAYDHFTAGRFRHGTTLLRWRSDKLPRHCTFDQVATHGRQNLKLLDECPSAAKFRRRTRRGTPSK